MAPKILDADRCPHCKHELTRPLPRMCPHCAGSLQKRHLSCGCLTSAPLFLAVGCALGALAQPRERAYFDDDATARSVRAHDEPCTPRRASESLPAPRPHLAADSFP